ncbi:hypothetical protein ACFX13_008249 [Malus domestica]
MNDYDGKCEISRIFNLLDIDSIEQLKHLDHMRFLLGWIGPQALDSDVQIFPVLSKNRSSFAEFTEWRKLSVWGFEFGEERRRRGAYAMGQRGEHIALKFRIYDGTDIGINTYAPSMTVSSLKKRLLAEWPHAKTVTPKSVDEVKIIHGGKVLENSKTLADSRITTGNQTGEAVIMHAVVQPLVPKNKRTGKKQKDMQKMNSCSCTLL